MTRAVIRVSAVVLQDECGAVLTVRKRGTVRFMLPGGKPEPGESAEQAAVRECREEIGAEFDPAALRPLGVFRADAANEHDHTVEATVFSHPAPPMAAPTREIEELRWLELDTPPSRDDVAPLLIDQVLPALRRAATSLPSRDRSNPSAPR